MMGKIDSLDNVCHKTNGVTTRIQATKKMTKTKLKHT